MGPPSLILLWEMIIMERLSGSFIRNFTNTTRCKLLPTHVAQWNCSSLQQERLLGELPLLADAATGLSSRLTDTLYLHPKLFQAHTGEYNKQATFPSPHAGYGFTLTFNYPEEFMKYLKSKSECDGTTKRFYVQKRIIL